jgi:cyclopropane fatty-acyl-phospholipid synthase-like methyltransferase
LTTARGTIGLGEAYEAGEWTSPDLVGFLELLYRNAEAAAERHPRLARSMKARPRTNRRQGLRRARFNIEYHYALGNDLFRLMLDETTTYSCAVFAHPDEELAGAQGRKLRRCDRLFATGGRACVQSILIPDHRWDRYRRSPDWIEGVGEIGADYAATLRRWRATFLARLGAVRALGYDEHFLRTWDFYLACCEAGFRTRALRNAQIVLER